MCSQQATKLQDNFQPEDKEHQKSDLDPFLLIYYSQMIVDIVLYIQQEHEVFP